MTSKSKRKLSFRRIAYKAAARDDRLLRLKAEIAEKVDLPYLVSLGVIRTSDDLLKLKNDYWFINANPQ